LVNSLYCGTPRVNLTDLLTSTFVMPEGSGCSHSIGQGGGDPNCQYGRLVFGAVFALCNANPPFTKDCGGAAVCLTMGTSYQMSLGLAKSVMFEEIYQLPGISNGVRVTAIGGTNNASVVVNLICQEYNEPYPSYVSEDTYNNKRQYVFDWNTKAACTPTLFQEECRACDSDIAYCRQQFNTQSQCQCYDKAARDCYKNALTMPGAPPQIGCNVTRSVAMCYADGCATGGSNTPLACALDVVGDRVCRECFNDVTYCESIALSPADKCACLNGAHACFARSNCANSYHLLAAQRLCAQTGCSSTQCKI